MTIEHTDDVLVVRGDASGFAQDITRGHHHLISDEPLGLGGTDTGPTPYDLLVAALGSCTSMTIGMYARRKEWPLERVTVRLSHRHVHAKDCEGAMTENGKIDLIERDIVLEGKLSDEQRERLLEIANRCPVHRTLTSETVIRSKLVER